MRSRCAVFLFLAVLGSGCGSESNPGDVHQTGVSTRGAAPDSVAAREALLRYLGHARNGDYAAAIALYGGDTASLPRDWFADDSMSAEDFLRQACQQRVLFCDLGVRRIVSSQTAAPDTVRFTVELSNPDGSRFEPPRCCGETGPPDTVFDFRVRQVPTGYRVLDLPVYRP